MLHAKRHFVTLVGTGLVLTHGSIVIRITTSRRNHSPRTSLTYSSGKQLHCSLPIHPSLIFSAGGGFEKT